MRRILAVLVVAVCLASSARGQTVEGWKESKKLTVLKQLPDEPKPQAKCMDPASIDKGDVGFLSCWQFRVSKVFDAKNMVIKMGGETPRSFMLLDHPTKDLANDDLVRLVGPVEVLGTGSALAEGGGMEPIRVLRLVRPERMAEVRDLEAAKAEIFEAENAPADEWETEARTWTDKTGKFTVRAVFAGPAGTGKIRLRREDGTHIVVPLSRLSEPDRRHAVALLRQTKAAIRTGQSD